MARPSASEAYCLPPCALERELGNRYHSRSLKPDGEVRPVKPLHGEGEMANLNAEDGLSPGVSPIFVARRWRRLL